MLRKELLGKVRENFKEINNRFNEVGMQGLQDYSIFLEYREKFGQLTSSTNTALNRVNSGSISRYNKSKLNDILEVQKKFLRNSWTTEQGRQSILDNAYNIFSKRNEGISEVDFLRLINVLESDTFTKLRDVKNISSDVIVALQRQSSLDKVISAMEAVINNSKFNELDREEIEELLFKEINNKSNDV